MKIKTNWDAWGIGTSIACAIHCALLPLFFSSLPLFGINIIHNVWFEWGMISLAFVIGSYSLFHGYFTHHRSPVPLLLFSLGFFFLVIKQIFHSYETLLLIPAVILMVYAHWTNYRRCHKAKHDCAHHQH